MKQINVLNFMITLLLNLHQIDFRNFRPSQLLIQVSVWTQIEMIPWAFLLEFTFLRIGNNVDKNLDLQKIAVDCVYQNLE